MGIWPWAGERGDICWCFRETRRFKNALCLCPSSQVQGKARELKRPPSNKLKNCCCGRPSDSPTVRACRHFTWLTKPLPWCHSESSAEGQFERRLGDSGSDRRSLNYAHDREQARQTELGSESAPGPPQAYKSVAVHGAAIAIIYSSSTSTVS